MMRTSAGWLKLRDDVDVATMFAILYRGVYDSLHISPDDIVLDIGANVGIFSVYAARSACKVIAVEPDKNNFGLLIQNVRVNKLRNVCPVCCALSDFNGTGFLSGKNTNIHLVTSQNRSPVVVKTVDRLLEELKVPFVDVVKVDAEGEESKILGNSAFLKHTREIVIETHGIKETATCERMLADYGFRVTRISTIRKFIQHLRKSRNLGEYLVANVRTGFNDFGTYQRFALSRLGVGSLSATISQDLGLIYGRRNCE
ncbi:MAG: FkbM family methyltransferase [Nitrososphaerota archaeon]|nr:FkbM family methyltransferase [Nitrososphaerota archaeon]